jgi:hypothetical protein
MSNVTMIKKDAKVTITIGAGFIGELQKLLISFSADKSTEEIEEFKKLAESGKTPTKPWMNNVIVIAALLKEIEIEAMKQNQTFKEDDSVIQEDNLSQFLNL